MMDFQQAESKFKQHKAQFEAGELTETEFKTKLEELMVQDEEGSWWMIGYETEMWYRHDGKDWVQADPPGISSKKAKPEVTAKSDKTESKIFEKVDPEIAKKATGEKAEREVTEEIAKEKTEQEPAKMGIQEKNAGENIEHEVTNKVFNKRQIESEPKIQKIITSFLQNNEIVIPNSNKTPGLALFLSYFSGGGGQIYLGQVKKGMVLILASALINILTSLLTIPLISAICATDAYCIAQKMKKGHSVKEWEFGFNWNVFLKAFLFVVVPIVLIGIILLLLVEYY